MLSRSGRADQSAQKVTVVLHHIHVWEDPSRRYCVLSTRDMSLRGDVCVLTGACGFLGMRLTKLLLEKEKLAEIRLMDKHVQPDLLHTLEGKIKRSHTFSN